MTSVDSRLHLIRTQLSEALQPTLLEIIDEGWQHLGHAEEGAGHFLVRIGSKQFTDKSIVECHQLVYTALSGFIGRDIHALRIEIQNSEEG